MLVDPSTFPLIQDRLHDFGVYVPLKRKAVKGRSGKAAHLGRDAVGGEMLIHHAIIGDSAQTTKNDAASGTVLAPV